MTFDRNIQSINYSIDTVAGTVYLMGVAQNQAELNKVIEVARTIPHVMQVVNYVKMAGETPRALQPSSQDNRNAGNSGNSNVMTAPTRNQTVESEELYWPDQ